MYPAPPVSLPQHRFGSARFALPGVEPEDRNQPFLNHAAALESVHAVAPAAWAMHRVTIPFQLNNVFFRHFPYAFLFHLTIPQRSLELPS
jgi:hypothetical protein